MEFLNKVELTGIVGHVDKDKVGDRLHVTMSVVTQYCHRNQDGTSVVYVTWTRVSAWEGPKCNNIDKIEKGSTVNIVGKLKNVKYTDGDGIDRHYTQVDASKVIILDANTQLVDEKEDSE